MIAYLLSIFQKMSDDKQLFFSFETKGDVQSSAGGDILQIQTALLLKKYK
jgi:hypothetical protein